MYHVMSRGNPPSPGYGGAGRRAKIFLDDVDRHDFIKTLAEACQKTQWQVHAYCLMPNHYHLVLETPEPNLVAGMAWLQSTYTIRLNHRHKLTGHVLSGRYKAQLVEGSGSGYLRTACDYVPLNPVRARLLPPKERLLAYPWSSFGAYLAAPEHRPGWVRVDRLLGEHGIQADTDAGRRQFEEWMERRRAEETDPESRKALRRGWCLGGDGFKRDLLLRMAGRLGEHHAGALHREAAVARAEQILEAELERRHWTKRDLKERRKNDAEKLAIAARLRRETTLSIKDIAALVHLGTSKGANANLHRHLRENPPSGPKPKAAARQAKDG